ncbi:hypothetical protein NDU88_004751 [Pleurodeles waltl]|uniref:Uncharacterized protein n=1 Tax=Pleurodeles waltl TaxID=8319 RepID=A0AAV7UHA7_PLEWA|nr:hypothetical protein NDU88_004751 [Pleurodeles waltl]
MERYTFHGAAEDPCRIRAHLPCLARFCSRTALPVSALPVATSTSLHSLGDPRATRHQHHRRVKEAVSVISLQHKSENGSFNLAAICVCKRQDEATNCVGPLLVTPDS